MSWDDKGSDTPAPPVSEQQRGAPDAMEAVPLPSGTGRPAAETSYPCSAPETPSQTLPSETPYQASPEGAEVWPPEGARPPPPMAGPGFPPSDPEAQGSSSWQAPLARSISSGEGNEQGYLAGKYRTVERELRERPYIIWTLGTIALKHMWKQTWFKILLGTAWLFTIVGHLILTFLAAGFGTSFEYRPADSLEFFTRVRLSFFAITFASLSAGRLISSDLADRSIYLYFTRPMTRLDYLAGRLLGSMMVMSLVVIVPALLHWFSLILISGSDATPYLWTVGAVLVYGLIYALVYSLIGLAFSASTTRHRWAAVGIFITFFFTLTMSEVAVAIAGDDHYYAFSVVRNLDILGHQIFQVSNPYDLGWGYSLGVLTMICALCMGFILYRLNNVEGKL